MAEIRSTDTRDIEVERLIPASPSEAFEGWLNPAVPGSPWHEHEELLLDVKVDGLWFWRSIGGNPHYGRFLELSSPRRARLTWMSPKTRGHETIVTFRFEARDTGTLLSIRHSGLPDDDAARAHREGWDVILGWLIEAVQARQASVAVPAIG